LGVLGPLGLKVPAWVSKDVAGDEKIVKALDRLRLRLAKRDVAAALPEALKDRWEPLRPVAGDALAAVGDLPAVMGALGDLKDPDVRRAAVTALRHWSGLGAAEDAALYRALVRAGHKPVEAQNVVEMLRPFSRRALGQRETYETLIDYLTHP